MTVHHTTTRKDRHKQFTQEQLATIGSEMNEVMGLLPPINVALDVAALYSQIVTNSVDLVPTDKASFRPETVRVLYNEGLWPGSPEPKPIKLLTSSNQTKSHPIFKGEERSMSTRKGTMTAFVEEKIAAGQDNKTIVAAIMEQYNLEKKPATMRLGAIRHNMKKKTDKETANTAVSSNG